MRRAGAFGMLHKVSEGVRFADAEWKQRAAAARAAGLHVGGYHFARTTGDARVQAQYFAHLLGPVGRRDLHPALDIETNDGDLSPARLLEWMRAFAERVHELTGVRCLYYSYPAFLAAQSWDHPPGRGAGLWLAAYGPNDGHDHGIPAGSTAPWRHAVAHQFTSVGRIAGVAGHVDLSHARSRRAMLAHGWRGLA